MSRVSGGRHAWSVGCRVSGLIALSVVLLGLCGGAASYAETFLPKAEATGGSAFRAAFASSVERVGPAVIEVRVGERSAALGCAVSPDGWVLTKASEVAGGRGGFGTDDSGALPGAGGVLCVRQDGTRWPALVVATDRATDLMLLKVAAPTEDWPWIDWGVGSDDQAGALADEEQPAPVAVVPSLLELQVGRWVVVPGVGGALERRSGGVLAAGVVSAAPRPVKSRAKMGVFFASGSVRPMVRFVQPESGAALAGLSSGDVLLAVDGAPTPTPLEVVEAVSGKLAGDTVALRVRRGGGDEARELELNVALGLGPDRPAGRSSRMNRAAGPVSARRSGFASAFDHDALIGPSACGGPVVSLDGRVWGLNIARPGRVGVLALPADQVRAALTRMWDEARNEAGPR